MGWLPGLIRWTAIEVITGRRHFIAGLLATGLVPKPTWADAGSPAYLSAAARPDGSFALCGIGAALDVRFELPLPARGHAAAAHPSRPEAVAFARRPGTFALVIDCVTGRQKAMLSAPKGRHFYGHGVFSADGALLFTTENDFEVGRGRIGVWDVARRYQRIDEWDSGGIGPHDIKRLPGSEMLVVANGGIDTHPESGRTKLNIPTMQPNLAYVSQGAVSEIAELAAPMHKNSIRHLAVSAGGQVAFGMQWQGDGWADALVGLHRRGTDIRLVQAPEAQIRAMDGYIGSIAFDESGAQIAATSPRGGILHVYDTATARWRETHPLEDVCGVAMAEHGFVVTSGTGELQHVDPARTGRSSHTGMMWDNHLVAL